MTTTATATSIDQLQRLMAWDAARRGQGSKVPFDEVLVGVHKPVSHLQLRMGGDEGEGVSALSRSIHSHVSRCEADIGSAQSTSQTTASTRVTTKIERCEEERYTTRHRDATLTHDDHLYGKGRCAAMANGDEHD